MKELAVPRVTDFTITGDGSSKAWKRMAWQPMRRIWRAKVAYRSRFKTVWSKRGIYVLWDFADRRLTCTQQPDNGNLWEEDVAEVFIQPDADKSLYFEYQVSPLGAELALLIPNLEGRFHGWAPWRYVAERRCHRATAVRGGGHASMARVDGWSAECFIPFALMREIGNCPPRVGTRWRANFYRIDYDQRPPTHWLWSPVSGATFHDPPNFGTLVFAE